MPIFWMSSHPYAACPSSSARSSAAATAAASIDEAASAMRATPRHVDTSRYETRVRVTVEYKQKQSSCLYRRMHASKR